MENYTIVIFIMVVMIALTAMADRIKLPYPILLIVAGMALGFIPSIPEIQIDPEIVFLIFLPPLLYDAAFNIRFQEFRTNMSTISSLAISLVFLTALGIGVIAHYCIPGMSWSLSFVLGAILAATDAVAATSITKGLGLPHKTLTILEGESLINDASALVAYRFAVAAVTGSAFVFWKAGMQFLLLMGGGLLVGGLIGKLLGLILRWVRKDMMVVMSLLLIMPFITYLLAEQLHVSGVIAVVVLGLSMAQLSRQKFPDNLKQQSKSVWDMIVFMLNGLIFILMGLEFPYVLKSIDEGQVWPNVGYAFLITVAALLIRMIRVFWQRGALQRAFATKRSRVQEGALLDVKNSLIISWSGMRGIVSLAIAFGLPTQLQDGTPFPQRSTIIFISVVVVLMTLLGQGLTLSWLIRMLNRKGKRAEVVKAAS